MFMYMYMERNCKCACTIRRNSEKKVSNRGDKEAKKPSNFENANERDVNPLITTNEVTSSPTHSKDGIPKGGKILFYLLTTSRIL